MWKRLFCCEDCAIAYNQKMAIDRNRRIKQEYKEEKRIKDEKRKEYVRNYALNRKKKKDGNRMDKVQVSKG